MATSGQDTWRVLVREVGYNAVTEFGQIGPDQTGILVVGADLGHLDEAVGWLAKVDLVVSVIIVAALLIVGVAMVRASLRPLRRMEATAAAIAAGDLSRRVPDRDPRTEVGRLGRSLNMMLSQIESAFHARARSEAAARRSEERMRQFVADASHELRTPLTAIRGYAEYYRQRGGLDNGSRTSGEPAHEPAPQPSLASTPDRWAASYQARHGPGSCLERVEQESTRMGGLVEGTSPGTGPPRRASARSSTAPSTCSRWPRTRSRTARIVAPGRGHRPDRRDRPRVPGSRGRGPGYAK